MKKEILTAVLVSSLTCIYAQVALHISADTTVTGIATPVQLTIRLSYDPEAKFTLPAPELILPAGKDAEVSPWVLRDSSTAPDARYIRYTQELTLFDTGMIELPPVPVPFEYAGRKDTIRSQPLRILVRAPAQGQDGLAPIADIVRSSGTPWYLVALLVLLPVAAILYWYLRRRRRQPDTGPAIPLVPALTPFEEALSALGKLERIRPDDTKEAYSRLSDIVRIYIGRSYPVAATELTSSELFRAISPLCADPVPDTLYGQLLFWDMIKFAKTEPAAADWPEHIRAARELILSLRPVSGASSPATS